MSNRTVEDDIREYIESYYHPNMLHKEWDDLTWDICVMVKDAMRDEGWIDPNGDDDE